jgi:pimeloyl-ACP methyl ester carboxylesterase
MLESHVVSGDGTRLAARRSGSGTPLVMVHGAMGDLNSFAPLEEPLAAQHTVWVYSRRGRGGSGDGPQYGLEREVEDVLAVLEAAGEGAHLFGHSSGAFYAWLAAPRARGLRSLTLYEPPLRLDRAAPAALEGMWAALDADDPDGALEAFFPVADITAEEAAMLRTQEPVWEALRRGVRLFPREHRALQDDGRRLLEATTPPRVPTLYLYGTLTEAPIYPTLEEVAERLPQARLEPLPGQRHVAPMFDPATFAQKLLAFTTAHDG